MRSSTVTVSDPSVSVDVLTAAVRDFARETDENFVYDSWGNSYRDACIAAWGPMDKAVYYKRLGRRIAALLIRGAELKLAVDPADPLLFLGWICAEPPLLHYVYVKRAYRGQGIALSLLAACGLASERTLLCTSWTPYADRIAAQRPSLLRRVELF